MHRLVMTSEAYRMASVYENTDSSAADPENRWLWRYRTQRLEAEALRDTIMTVSGGIDLTVGGPPIFPHVPEGILKASAKGIWHNELERACRLAPQCLCLPPALTRVPLLRHV